MSFLLENLRNLRKASPAVFEAPPTPEPDTAPTPIETSITTSPGQFRKPSDFSSLGIPDHLARPPDVFPPHHSFQEEPFSITQIVHITHRDHDSPFHNRIMLVIRLNTSSLTCLSFCTHKHAIPSQLSAHHAKLITTPTLVEEGTQDDGYFKVRVSLEEGTPVKEVYIDLRDQETVPRDSSIKFVVLGFAEANSFEDVLWKVLELSAESFKLDLRDYGRRVSSGREDENPVVEREALESEAIVVMEVAGSERRQLEVRRPIENMRGHSKRDKRAREISNEKHGHRSSRVKEKKISVYQKVTGRKVSPRPF